MSRLKRMNKLTLAVLLAGTVLLAGCRGMISEKPPVHPNLNMDFQEKFQAQEANPFFADGRAMRPPVPGTVARGLLKEDTRFYLGRTETGEYLAEMPVPVTRELLMRGRERYNIYCTVCHGGAGDGQGIIMTGQSSATGQGYGYTPAPSYHIDRLREVGDGYMYDVITNGVRNMPGYAQQISVLDRWAIVAYVRALQLSQNAGEDDVPPSELAKIAQGASANMEGGRTGADATGGGSNE
jgi:mono/diheme cytochrome c family protein